MRRPKPGSWRALAGALWFALGACSAAGCAEATAADAGLLDAGVDAGLDPTCAVPEGAHASVGAGRAEGYRCERFPAALHAPRDVWVSRAGEVYVTEMAGGRIARLVGDRFETVAEGLLSPIGLREDASGQLLVAEEGRRTLSRIDPTTGERTLVAGDLRNVTYLAVGPDGAAYVSSFAEVAPTGTGVVWRVDLETGVARAYATGLHVPEGLLFSGDALTAVEWHAPSAVRRFAAGGGDAADATTLTTDLSQAYGLAGDGDGGVLVGDHAGRILHVREDGSSRVLLDAIGRPGGITRTDDGTIWIAEFVGFGETGYLIRLTPE